MPATSRAAAGEGRARVFWPLPALFAWGACWGVFVGLRALEAPSAIALALAALLGAALAATGPTPWRRVFIACGFPLSLAASGLAAMLPAWAWLAPLASLVLVYPLDAWRDAPVFPTPKGALAGLARQLELRDGAEILDAGCGLGDALVELKREYPRAVLTGIEWSWPLRVVSGWRCRFAAVRRADMWAAEWCPFDLVYVLQRPESMPRAAAKAALEFRSGAWLASLEFPVDAWRPARVFRCADGRALWLYRAPFDLTDSRAIGRSSRAAPELVESRGCPVSAATSSELPE